jgi:hypothetical protein
MGLGLKNQTKNIIKSKVYNESDVQNILTQVLHNLAAADMPIETHSLIDGKLHVYRREGSRFWQCSTYMTGRNHRQTTKETNLPAAIDFARDWYMERYVADSRKRRGGRSLLLDEPVQPLIADPGMPRETRPRRTPNGPTFKQPKHFFASMKSSRRANATPIMFGRSSTMCACICCPSLATRRLPRSRLAWCRNTVSIGKPHASTPRPTNRRNQPVRRCMAKSSLCGRC